MLTAINAKFQVCRMSQKAHYAEYRYAECHCAECYCAECRYAECHCAECRYTKCRGAQSGVGQARLYIYTTDNGTTCFLELSIIIEGTTNRLYNFLMPVLLN